MKKEWKDFVQKFVIGIAGGLFAFLGMLFVFSLPGGGEIGALSDIYHNRYTHYIATRLLMQNTAVIDFNTASSGETINSSTADQLDIDATTEVEITASVLDLKGRLDVGTGFWADAPSPGNNDLSVGFFYTEDFIYFGIDTTAAGLLHVVGWNTAGNASATLTQAAGTLGGWATFNAVTASDNESYHQLGELGTETYVEFTASSGFETWIEFKLNPLSITNAANLVFGLAEEGAAAANFIADTGNDISDVDFIGFIQYEDNPDTVRLAYQTSGGALGFADSVLVTATATTYGLYFDGATTISWYIGGSSVGTVLTSASLVPDTEELSPIIGIKQGAADGGVNIDWIKVVGER